MATIDYDHEAEHIEPGTAFEEPSRSLRWRIKVLGGLLALVAAAALGWVVWIAYDEGVRTGTVKTVPVIRADAGEIKRKPDQPGGLEVPHQDTLVFGRLAPGQANEPVERLLPLPEVPIKLPVSGSSRPPEVKAVGPTTVRPDTEIVAAPPPAKKVPSVPTVGSAEIVTNTPPSAAKEKVQSPAKVVLKTPDSAPEPAPVEKQPVIPPEAAWRIQLVALNNPKDAERVWGRLQKANSDLLGGLTLRVLAAKLKKGTFYRVQAGPLASRAAASALCGTLQSRKQDCLVVAPKR